MGEVAITELVATRPMYVTSWFNRLEVHQHPALGTTLVLLIHEGPVRLDELDDLIRPQAGICPWALRINVRLALRTMLQAFSLCQYFI